MKTFSVSEATSHLPDLLALVERGEEVLIARNDRPIARLSAMSAPGTAWRPAEKGRGEEAREAQQISQRDRILAFAGCWNDLDAELWEQLEATLKDRIGPFREKEVLW